MTEKNGSAGDQCGDRQRARALYELALEDISWHPETALKRFKWTKATLWKTAGSLEEIGLFSRSSETPSGWLALPPQAAAGNLLDTARSRMLDFYEDMTRTGVVMTDVLTQFKTIYMRQLEDNRLKVLEKQPEILATLERELLGAHSEVLLQGSGHLYTEALAPVCHSLLRRGVAVRVVVRSSTATLPQPAAKLRDLAAAGAEARISPTLPISFALVDDSMAMFYAPPSRLTEDDAAGPRMVVAHSPLVNEVLRPVFDHYWNHSASVVFQGQKAAGRRGSGEPAPEESGRPAAAAPAVSPAGRPRDKRQLALLRMLASGLTDQTISRHLGMHERTVRRKVAELAASLHAASRFQAGVNAAKAGWLDEDLDAAG